MSASSAEPYVLLAVLRWRWWLMDAAIQGRWLAPISLWTFP